MCDVFDTSNSEDFKNNVEKLIKTFPAIKEPINNPLLPVGKTTPYPSANYEIAAIFKKK